RLAEAARLGFRFALVPPGCGPESTGVTPEQMRVMEVTDVRSALQCAARASAE
ncbi:DNA repair protein RadA, partial [Micromonospora azadirachtae]